MSDTSRDVGLLIAGTESFAAGKDGAKGGGGGGGGVTGPMIMSETRMYHKY